MPPKKRRQPESYEQIRKKWYAKLARTGFKDIEKNDVYLKRYDSHYFAHQAFHDSAARNQHYYQLANEFLNDYAFSSNLERIVWEYHANGMSMRDIAVTINKTRVAKLNKDNVNIMLMKLVRKMKAMYGVSVRRLDG